MAASYGQGVLNISGNSVTVTGVQAGSTLYVTAFFGVPSPGTLTFSDGTNYTNIGSATDGASATVGSAYLANAASGSHTITATSSSDVNAAAIMVSELRGVATSSPLDSAPTNGGLNTGASDGASVNSGTLSGTTGDILISHYWGEGAFVIGSGFAAGSVNDQTDGVGDEYEILGAATSGVWTATVGGDTWVTAAAFKPSASGDNFATVGQSLIFM